MATVQTHIVRSQRVVVQYQGEQVDAFAIQRQLTDLLLGNRASQALDTVLSEFSSENEWVVLDKVEIDLGKLVGNDWETSFLDQLQTSLRKGLFDAIPDAVLQGKTVQKSPKQLDFEQFIFFLRHGYFEYRPPEIDRGEGGALHQWMANLLSQLSDEQVRVLVTILWQNPATLQRFVNQLPPEAVPNFLKRIAGGQITTDTFPEQFFTYLQSADADHKLAAFRQLLARVKARQPIDLVVLTGEMTSVDTPKSVVSTDSHEQPPKQPIFVQNAGVVLLHPYVSICFDALGWLSGGQFVDDVAQQKAILMWHYLATGQDTADEYELTLAKLLSGFPVQAPFLGGEVTLTKAEKEEGESMLQAVIGHWSAIKNTSPDGLRAEFLQRDGKLESNALGGYTVTVEKRASDILVDRLPWGISLLKLGWMKDILYVNWL